MRTEETKAKVQDTCTKKFGGHPMQNETVLKKQQNTNNQKYGGNSPLCSAEVRAKAAQTMSDKNKVAQSTEQKAVYDIISSLYRQEKVEYNINLSSLFLDIRLIINDIKIDIEYDGSYWHKNKQKEDRRRDEWVKSQGYKIFRIKSGHKVPTNEQIQEKINFLIESNYSYTELVLEDW